MNFIVVLFSCIDLLTLSISVLLHCFLMLLFISNVYLVLQLVEFVD